MNGMIAAQGSENMPLLSNDYKPTEALLVGSRTTGGLPQSTGSSEQVFMSQVEESSLQINDLMELSSHPWVPCLPSWQLKTLMGYWHKLRVRAGQSSDGQISRKHSWAVQNVVVRIWWQREVNYQNGRSSHSHQGIQSMLLV